LSLNKGRAKKALPPLCPNTSSPYSKIKTFFLKIQTPVLKIPSAINHPFGGKKERSSEVLKNWHGFPIQEHLPLPGVSENTPLEDRLRVCLRVPV
jgi:hypothetical protein